MKKFSLFLTICMAFVLASCAKEEFPVDQQTSNTRIVKMYQAKDGKLIYLGCREMSADEPFIKPMTTKALDGYHYQGMLDSNNWQSQIMDLEPRSRYAFSFAVTGLNYGQYCSVTIRKSDGYFQMEFLESGFFQFFIDNESILSEASWIDFFHMGTSATCFYDVTLNGIL